MLLLSIFSGTEQQCAVKRVSVYTTAIKSFENGVTCNVQSSVLSTVPVRKYVHATPHFRPVFFIYK
jgi:hypothetical protein